MNRLLATKARDQFFHHHYDDARTDPATVNLKVNIPPTSLLDASIQYVIPHPEQDFGEASPFQGFIQGILETAWFIRKILTLPANYLELLLPQHVSLYQRMHGVGYVIVPVDSRYLGYLPISARRPFVCLFSYEKTWEAALSFISNTSSPILHVSTVNSHHALPWHKLTRGHIDAYCGRVLRYFHSHEKSSEYEWWVAQSKRPRKKWNRGIAPIPARHHNCTSPNEFILQSIGYELRKGSVLVADSDRPYIDAVLSGYDQVMSERVRISGSVPALPLRPPESTNLVISAPSVYRHLYFEKNLLQKFDRKVPRKVLRLVGRFLVKQEKYYDTAPMEDIKSLMASAVGKAIIQIRQQELEVHTLASSAIACSTLAPVIRLPNGVNRIYQDAKRLGDCARGHSPHRAVKMTRIARTLVEKMQRAIPSEYIARLSGTAQNIKLLSDVPLEWLRVDGLPLMYRHNVVRLPTTPGSLFFGETLLNRDHAISSRDLDEILVVRSFSDTDPLRRVLEHALNEFGKMTSWTLRVRFVDVKNEAELIRALDSYGGALMIYDGHGKSMGHSDIAGMVIGGVTIDSWLLRGRTRIPPIVLLSACDTHPVDGSHASTANGFIVSGARTVLATLLPIHAVDSARFLARFLFRIAEYLPAILSYRSAIRWSSVVAGLQRMTFVTEVLERILEPYNISDYEKVHERIHYEANLAINTENDDWYKGLLDNIGSTIGVQSEFVESLVDRYLFLSESMKYIQIGNADKLVIVKGNTELKGSPISQPPASGQ